ncbi:hypothetical protein SAMN05192561_11028 [Halopenitus malekzadehii]|uniref:Uncharacterized protein n=1 Tax=Halopenitus malekzadehii TaxID=1267564 RepID=A0A1H6JEL0_9EURY|nr:hypothetical protein [Halopenitus malekzadehii]SEH59136.1 hypothetical protein SAMN05192561_11028 [Halopenitus malekzadehii]
MRLGLLDTIGLATTLIFAIPVANYGVVRVLDGETTLGVAMVVIAVAMVVLPQYFLDPERILRGLLAGLLPSRLRAAGSDDAEEPAAGSADRADVDGSSEE